jgi:AraC-like DNA-binding protein
MDHTAYHAARDRVLWHFFGMGSDERHTGNQFWWHDNAGRQPSGVVVFQIMLAGHCVLRTPDGEHEVGPGQAFLFCYDEPTAYGRPPDRPDWPWHGEMIHTAHIGFGGAGLRAHWDVLRARFGPVVTLGETTTILELLRDIETNYGKRGADRRAASPAIHAFVMRCFDEIEAASAVGLSPVERAVDELLRAPLSGHSLKSVARHNGITREHLTRVFAERVGMAPATWLRDARLQRALELLRATELPLATVAAQSGFASVRTLARLVRKQTGIAPGRLRHEPRTLPPRRR